MKTESKLWIALAALFFVLTGIASAFQINPNTAAVSGSTFTVTVLNDSGLPAQGVLVQFVLESGMPVFNMTNAQGIAVFKPDLTGTLVIKATTMDGILLASTSVPVAAPAAAPPPSGGGGSGGGGGGGGGTSGENFSNILMKESYDLSIFMDKLTSYRFKDARNPVVFVNITGKKNSGVINTLVEVLKGTSTLVTSPPPGTAYKNVNIFVGDAGFRKGDNIKEGIVAFKVENSWMSANGIERDEIKMVKWEGGSWITLDTREKMRDGMNTYYEAKTTKFSSFALVGIKAVPAAAPPEVTATPSKPGAPAAVPPAAVPTSKKTSGFEVAIAAAALSVLYLIRMRK